MRVRLRIPLAGRGGGLTALERLDDYLRDKRALVEKHLAEKLRPQAGLPASLLEAMRYSLLAPGKRLRPILVVMASEACGGTDPWPAACAVEMIHAYSLIHDDLPAMDDDDLRRGLPTCHKKFGEALAILAGDALLTLAFGVLAEGYPDRTAAACCRELARAAGAAGMVGGQVDDLAWEQESDRRLACPTVEGLEQLHLRKTGALIQASLRLGALAAYAQRPSPPPASLLECLDGYGRCLGLAFQIVDDLLDVEGDAEQTGKRVGKDAARGKLTYPGFLGVAESRHRAERLGREACERLQPLGDPADRLRALVSYVLERDR
ncbi:MAG TPA: farnesyl diphosphate synthase [Gemmataceae bacterium]|nr:farnesyl diphosphate synthase [Gemmataceae bacterium]